MVKWDYMKGEEGPKKYTYLDIISNNTLKCPFLSQLDF